MKKWNDTCTLNCHPSGQGSTSASFFLTVLSLASADPWITIRRLATWYEDLTIFHEYWLLVRLLITSEHSLGPVAGQLLSQEGDITHSSRPAREDAAASAQPEGIQDNATVTMLPDNPTIPAAIEEALAPAVRFETALRQHSVLSDPHIGLIDVFDTLRASVHPATGLSKTNRPWARPGRVLEPRHRAGARTRVSTISTFRGIHKSDWPTPTLTARPRPPVLSELRDSGTIDKLEFVHSYGRDSSNGLFVSMSQKQIPPPSKARSRWPSASYQASSLLVAAVAVKLGLVDDFSRTRVHGCESPRDINTHGPDLRSTGSVTRVIYRGHPVRWKFVPQTVGQTVGRTLPKDLLARVILHDKPPVMMYASRRGLLCSCRYECHRSLLPPNVVHRHWHAELHTFDNATDQNASYLFLQDQRIGRSPSCVADMAYSRSPRATLKSGQRCSRWRNEAQYDDMPSLLSQPPHVVMHCIKLEIDKIGIAFGLRKANDSEQKGTTWIQFWLSAAKQWAIQSLKNCQFFLDMGGIGHLLTAEFAKVNAARGLPEAWARAARVKYLMVILGSMSNLETDMIMPARDDLQHYQKTFQSSFGHLTKG
ncbi:hypothetical protein BJ912DRAFT_1042030 [Pholiota molesta]|nr:hypothetical protein BJ912DRAFT_1042030 [Pholiota molesta]